MVNGGEVVGQFQVIILEKFLSKKEILLLLQPADTAG